MLNVHMEFPLGIWLYKKYLCGKIEKSVYENICFRNAAELFGIKMCIHEVSDT